MRGHKVKTLVQGDLQGVRITFFTGFPPLPSRGSDCTNELRRKVRGVLFVASPKVFANLRVRHPPHFPGAIGVFEPRSQKALLREIPEDQIAFGDRGVLCQIPRLSNREVAQQILGGIGRERNRDEIAEQFGQPLTKCASARARNRKRNSESSRNSGKYMCKW